MEQPLSLTKYYSLGVVFKNLGNICAPWPGLAPMSAWQRSSILGLDHSWCDIVDCWLITCVSEGSGQWCSGPPVTVVPGAPHLILIHVHQDTNTFLMLPSWLASHPENKLSCLDPIKSIFFGISLGPMLRATLNLLSSFKKIYCIDTSNFLHRPRFLRWPTGYQIVRLHMP